MSVVSLPTFSLRTVSMSSASNSGVASAAEGPVKKSLASLKAGQESLAKFVVDLFGDLESLCQTVVKAETKLRVEQQELARQRDELAEQLAQQRSELAEQLAQQKVSQTDLDQSIQAKMAEWEKDRQALEAELATARAQNASMAQTIAEQKREMADEHAEWATELRQLRRVLDKQSPWVADQSDSAGLAGAELENRRQALPSKPAELTPAAQLIGTGANRSKIIPVELVPQ
jgi:chromosome segregation ATPase